MENEKEISFSERVSCIDGKIIRNVDNITEAEKIAEFLSQKNILGVNVVDTRIYDYEKSQVEHEFIHGIIHSEEYTESMAYDVCKAALELSVELEKNSIYSWDLLPHNYTFHNGKWILYDFEALSLYPDKIKTQLRGFFKIVFSSFEFLKHLPRKKLKHYFLNRVKMPDLLTMIPIYDWVKVFFELYYSLFLVNTKQYSKMYKYLYKVLESYESSHKKHVYELKTNDSEILLFKNIKNIINSCQISNIFCTGENAAKYALYNIKDINAMIYIEDYDVCDDIYNFIIKNKLNNMSTGVLYPLENDENIPDFYKFRAIYDNYAKKRFNCDCAIYLDDCNVEFIKNISDFANKLFIVKVDSKTLEEVKPLLSDLYMEIDTFETGNNTYIKAVNKRNIFKYKKTENSYKNFNRGYSADEQTKIIKNILKY